MVRLTGDRLGVGLGPRARAGDQLSDKFQPTFYRNLAKIELPEGIGTQRSNQYVEAPRCGVEMPAPSGGGIAGEGRFDLLSQSSVEEKEKGDRVELREVLRDAIVDSPTTPTLHRQRLRLERGPRLQRQEWSLGVRRKMAKTPTTKRRVALHLVAAEIATHRESQSSTFAPDICRNVD
ncbi:hypothetical protein KCU95_g26, partial [Aureobasidium melanogenum]